MNFRPSCRCAGKILNCLKADYDKIFKDDIITDLLKVPRLRCRGARLRRQRTFLRSTLRKACAGSYHHLHRCRCGRLPDPASAHSDYAVPSGANADRTGATFILRSRRCMRSPTVTKSYFAFDEERKSGLSLKSWRQKILIQRSKGLRREPARNDVGDHHEPRKSPSDPYYAG